jgi:hypothetical protein
VLCYLSVIIVAVVSKVSDVMLNHLLAFESKTRGGADGATQLDSLELLEEGLPTATSLQNTTPGTLGRSQRFAGDALGTTQLV